MKFYVNLARSPALVKVWVATGARSFSFFYCLCFCLPWNLGFSKYSLEILCLGASLPIILNIVLKPYLYD